MSKAVDKQRQWMHEEAVVVAGRTEDRLNGLTEEIRRHVGEMQTVAEKNKTDVANLYGWLREQIEEREA